LNRVCLIRETKKTRSVGVPPGTGLGNTAVEHYNVCIWIRVIQLKFCIKKLAHDGLPNPGLQNMGFLNPDHSDPDYIFDQLAPEVIWW